MLKFLYFLSLCLVLGTGCTAQMVTSKKIEKLISDTLAVGDNSNVIESFLKENNIAFSFDSFSSRYQCIIRDPSKNLPKGYHSIIIYIYVDDNKNFKHAEVKDSYTFL